MQQDVYRVDHIHITLITVYSYNCPVLLVIVVNLLQSLICKVTFIIGMYV